MTISAFVGNALDFLDQPPAGSLPPVVILAGSERFMQLQVLKRVLPSDAMDRVIRYGEEDVEWSRVADDLSARSLFIAGSRIILMTSADSFVQQNRQTLEKHAAQPRGSGVLILLASSLPSNTNLYKAVSAHGWMIECRLPETKSGKSKEVDGGRMRKWLEGWAKSEHKIKLHRDATKQLSELVGWECGLLDQELAKLALFVPTGGEVSVELVNRVVGGWRAQTNWEMLDAACDGKAADAIQQLDHLLQSGDAPVALFGSISWSLRRFAAVTRMVQMAEKSGKRVDLPGLLTKSGFYGPGIAKGESQLIQITRSRSSQLYQWLLEADLALKGSHSSPSASRWVLERLFLRLAREARPGSKSVRKNN